ncbi:hypothetical protein [Xanthobacter autotrophicus]|uniref:hypothetical protein n=1 Tax=Xanthobacter autotrophicus TaxID=280 RepID=UPI003726754F
MILNLAGRATALVLTLLAVAGILALILLDLLGAEGFAKLVKAVTPDTPPPALARNDGPGREELARARDITFFTEARVEGFAFAVITGVLFRTVDDLLAARQASRWCYVTVGPRSGLARHITLGEQDGTAPPAYATLSAFPAGEFSALGVDAAALQAIARSHCRFTPAPGGSRVVTRGPGGAA